MEFKKRLLLERNLGWTPNVQPDKAEDLPDYLFAELTKLSDALFQLKNTHLDRTTSYPPKPRDGDMTLIDDDTEGGLYLYDKDHWTELNVGDSAGGFPIGGIIIWTGSSIPDGWALCDGNNAPNGVSTPDLQDRFVKGAGSVAVGTTGGSTATGTHILTTAQIPSHNHTQSGTFSSNTTGNHGHGMGGAGSHNHGITGTVLTASSRHASGGTNNRDYVESSAAFNSEPSHTHSINDAGNHEHSTTISGNTGTKGSSGGHTHSLDPVYYAVAYIMRYE